MTLRVRAHNSAHASENRIHSDEVARQYGFRAGLVPGTAVFGYLMLAVGNHPQSVHLSLLKPVLEGDELSIRREGALLEAHRGEELCARVTVAPVEWEPQAIPEAPLPSPHDRAPATAQTLEPGLVLGSIRKVLTDIQPDTLLEMANHALMRNFQLGPWLHVSSEIMYQAAPRMGDEILACSRIHGLFEKKGHAFVVLDLALTAGQRHIQSIRHTAIYQLARPTESNP